MELTNNTILITGGTSGIGLGFAEEFSKLGNKVIICGRREERFKEIEKRIPGIVTKKCDISKAEDRINLIKWATSEFPGLNIFINNAGIQNGQQIGKPVDLNKVQQEVDTNFIAPLHLNSLIENHLKSKKHSAIINISSGLAFAPLSFMPVYCATKAALHSYTMSLRHQLRNTSIKVFEIAPPAVDTELGQDRRTGAQQSHGGISVEEFISETMIALKNDEHQAAIGTAKGLMEKREQLFGMMNRD
jgi:uncharacterized oxidoreductase